MTGELNRIRQFEVLKPPLKREGNQLKKKVKFHFDGRWLIAILFLFTVIASLYFYLKTELPRWWEEFFSPSVVIYQSPK
ncbi:MAG TPA: hypothetical protein VMW41_06635 [Candidatus Bathyarchaeia archaeon]|nr:hypothetical protein [Candidatus Bathyarchaeia archaeon]